jgi:hypothetical protein
MINYDRKFDEKYINELKKEIDKEFYKDDENGYGTLKSVTLEFINSLNKFDYTIDEIKKYSKLIYELNNSY